MKCLRNIGARTPGEVSVNELVDRRSVVEVEVDVTPVGDVGQEVLEPGMEVTADGAVEVEVDSPGKTAGDVGGDVAGEIAFVVEVKGRDETAGPGASFEARGEVREHVAVRALHAVEIEFKATHDVVAEGGGLCDRRADIARQDATKNPDLGERPEQQ